jgi:hypothetical protein
MVGYLSIGEGMKVGTLVRHITHRDAIGMIVEKKLPSMAGLVKVQWFTLGWGWAWIRPQNIEVISD